MTDTGSLDAIAMMVINPAGDTVMAQTFPKDGNPSRFPDDLLGIPYFQKQPGIL